MIFKQLALPSSTETKAPDYFYDGTPSQTESPSLADVIKLLKLHSKKLPIQKELSSITEFETMSDQDYRDDSLNMIGTKLARLHQASKRIYDLTVLLKATHNFTNKARGRFLNEIRTRQQSHVKATKKKLTKLEKKLSELNPNHPLVSDNEVESTVSTRNRSNKHDGTYNKQAIHREANETNLSNRVRNARQEYAEQNRILELVSQGASQYNLDQAIQYDSSVDSYNGLRSVADLISETSEILDRIEPELNKQEIILKDLDKSFASLFEKNSALNELNIRIANLETTVANLSDTGSERNALQIKKLTTEKKNLQTLKIRVATLTVQINALNHEFDSSFQILNAAQITTSVDAFQLLDNIKEQTRIMGSLLRPTHLQNTLGTTRCCYNSNRKKLLKYGEHLAQLNQFFNDTTIMQTQLENTPLSDFTVDYPTSDHVATKCGCC